MTRPDWDEYFLGMLPSIGARATCGRGRSACLVSRKNYQLAAGYVGSPSGFPHCDEVGHQFIMVDGRQHCARTVHAEQNAIITAAKHGSALDKSTFYCTMEPCSVCAMMIIAVGAKRVVAYARYAGATESRKMFEQAGVTLDVKNDKELY